VKEGVSEKEKVRKGGKEREGYERNESVSVERG